MECNFENCPNFERLGKKFADRISELEQENAELKAYKDVNEDFKTAWEELKAENDRLKEEVQTEKIYSSQIEELEESIVGQKNAYKKLNSMYEENCEYTGKLEHTLQEIKAIICGNYEIIDPQGRKDILKLINKAEEE